LKKRLLLVLIILLVCITGAYAADTGEKLIIDGITKFRNGDFDQAIYDFREVTLDTEFKKYQGDAYFWLAKCYIALSQYTDGEKNLEFYLLQFPDHRFYEEGFYQKGRLLYLQTEYEKSIQVFYSFIETYPESPFLGNSYYWIGECLYELGHAEKALTLFTHVVNTFPASFKVEAARYKISLINLQKRERELLTFLKWSHEESLNTIEDFQIREKTYEQALEAYQKKLSDFAEKGTSSQLEALTNEMIDKDRDIITLKNQLTDLKRENKTLAAEIDQLRAALEEKDPALAEKIPETPIADSEILLSESTLRSLLALKEEALELKEFYINWLEKNLEAK